MRCKSNKFHGKNDILLPFFCTFAVRLSKDSGNRSIRWWEHISYYLPFFSFLAVHPCVRRTFFLFSLCPAQCQESDSLRFGTPYEDAVRQLTTLYGVPSVMDENHCVFKNSLFEHGGITFNEVKCNFKNRRLVEERFYKTAPTKRIAVRDMMQMKQALESQYSLSEDYEDDGTAFFCGGLAPTGIGRLFTLSVLPHRGRWAMLLQYGPFHYKDRNTSACLSFSLEWPWIPSNAPRR